MQRKIALIVMIAAMVCNAVAQNTQAPAEPKFYDTSSAKHFMEFKPYFAIGESSIIQNYSRVITGLSDIQLSPGMMLRGGVDVRFALFDGMAIGTGLAYQQSKSQYAMSVVDNSNGSINSIYVKNSFSELYAPIFVSWRFNLGRRMRWNVDAGWYFAKGLDGKMRISGYTSGENSLGQPIITHAFYESKYFNDDRSIINGIDDFDTGLHLATGMQYHTHYSLNVVFDISAHNLANNYDVLKVRYRNMRIALELGYNF